MKKRFLAITLGLCTVVSVAGCGKKLSNDVITIEQYKGLEVEKVEVQKVTDEDVENSIKTTIEQAGKTISITDRAVENGDPIVLDYSGKLDGETFEGGTAKDQNLTIGSGAFIPGFEEAIIGHKAGETFDINVTFPEVYQQNQDLAGKPVVFTITIDKIVGYPELTEALLAELKVEEKTVEEYKEKVRKDLEASNQQAADSALEQNVWAALVEKCTIKEYPEDKYNEVTTQINNQYNYLAQMYGMTVDQLLQAYYKVTLDEMAKQLIKQEYAVELIVKKEKLTASEKEYEDRVAEYVERFGYESREKLEESVGKKAIEKMINQEKVADFLIENSVQVEEKAKK